VADGVLAGLRPLNGLRHVPAEGTSGWFFWTGDVLSEADDFFLPYHLTHLEESRPELVPYLALPPGWRFLIAPGFEDVWFDETLLTS
jgi:hypothetical protein